jgi:hypothetical protein
VIFRVFSPAKNNVLTCIFANISACPVVMEMRKFEKNGIVVSFEKVSLLLQSISHYKSSHFLAYNTVFSSDDQTI